MIRAALISEAKALTEIAKQSKAFWGYSKAHIKIWDADLTITEHMLKTMMAYVYIHQNQIVAFYIFGLPKNKTVELEFLFVLPNFIGKGIGTLLMKHFLEKARANVDFIRVLSDPNAEDFYTSFGFSKIGKKESSIAGRFLPIMQLDLK